MSNLAKRISALEEKNAELEAKIERIEARRRRLVPAFIDNDPNVQELMADAIKSAVTRWEQCLAERNVSIKQARMYEAQAQALRELEEMGKAQHQREAAQLAALAQFYEKHGYLPEGCGFEIADDGFEPINTSGSLMR
jgi:1,6-anhydro-N-acetylmuramate kinase